MTAASKISVVLLVIFNFLFVVAGGLMLAFGIAAAVKPESVETMLSSVEGIKDMASASGFDLVTILQRSSIFLIVMGGVVVIIGIFGCFGACCRNTCMLGTYIAILVVIVLAEVALIIFAVVYPDKFRGEFQPAMRKTLDKFDSDGSFNANGSYVMPTSPVAVNWALMQFKLFCCGAYDYGDYANLTFTRLAPYPNAKVSISCCRTLSNAELPKSQSDFKNLANCLSANPDPENINEANCYDQLETLLKQYGRIGIGIAAGIIGLEVVLIILAIIICRSTNKYVPKRI